MIIKGWVERWGYTFGIIEVLVDEVHEGVTVCRVEEVSMGTENVESSSYSVTHSCLHTLVCKN